MPGTVQAVDSNSLTVTTVDGNLLLGGITALNGAAVDVTKLVSIGVCIPGAQHLAKREAALTRALPAESTGAKPCSICTPFRYLWQRGRQMEPGAQIASRRRME